MVTETNIFKEYEVLKIGADKYQFRVNKKLAEYEREQNEEKETMYKIASFLLEEVFIGTKEEATAYIEENYETLIASMVDAECGNYISELIRAEYSQDRVEALTFNYLGDMESYKDEYEDYQQFRAECKLVAKQLYYPEIN